MNKSKQYDITTTIRVTVPDDNSSNMTAQEWANMIAKQWSEMALNYKSIGADEIVRIDTVET